MNRAALKERIFAVNIAEYVGQWIKETIKDIEFSMHLRIAMCMGQHGIKKEQLKDAEHTEALEEVAREIEIGDGLMRFARMYFASLSEACVSSQVMELRQMMRELFEGMRAITEEFGDEGLALAHVPQMFMDSITPALWEVVLQAVRKDKSLSHACEECFPDLDAEQREHEVSLLIAELIPDV